MDLIRRWKGLVLFLLIAGPAAVCAGAVPQTTPAQDGALVEIVKRLGSDDFAVREGAQKELEKLTWRDRATLQQLADSATDVETKARLQARLEEIEIQLATDPPAISLDLKNASLSDVCSALEKELGMKFNSQQRGFAGNAMTYTLSVKDKPFWEVFQALSAQHPIMIQGYNGLQMFQQEPGLSRGVVVGGVAVFPMSISRSRNANLQKAAGSEMQPEQMNLQFMVAIDPRLKVVKHDQPQLTEAIDDAGNVLLKNNKPLAGGGMNVWDSGNTLMWQTSASLTIPEKPGKAIASAKGEMRFLLQVAAIKVEVTEVEKKLHQNFQVGTQTMVINQFEVKNNIVQFQVARQQNPADAARGGGDIPGVQMTFIDATGRRIWTTNVQGGSGGSAGGGDIQGPVKVEFSVATKTKELIVPFEFKGLPLP